MQGLFSFRGTLDRTRFAVVYVGAVAVVLAGSLAVIVGLGLLSVGLKSIAPRTAAVLDLVRFGACMGMLALGLWITFAACAKRLRSAGLSAAWLLALMILMPIAENIVLSELEPLRAFYIFWDKPFSAAVTFALHLLMFLWPPRDSANIADAFGPSEVRA